MELRHLEYFVAVAEERHFTRAAERLLVSQSGLSASVRSLERELGARLFLRSTRSVELTAAGHALLIEARRTLAGMRAAKDAVAAVQGLLRGTLAVGSEQCMLSAVDVPALLARFRSLHPGVELQLQQAGSQFLADEVAAGRLDLAFVALCGAPPQGIRLLPLAAERMVLLCRPEHPLVARETVEWDDLRGEPFVDFTPDWGARALADQAFGEVAIKRQVTVEVNDVHSLITMVGHGLGIALVPEPLAHKEQAASLCHVRLPDATTPAWRASIAVPEQTGPAARRMIGLVPGV
jgi:DNA-binding transcriptional LysR family regulator